MDHLSIPDASGLTGVLIAAVTLVRVLYTQRQARRAAAHDDFRDDFRTLAESLRKEIARLDQRVTELRTELDQHQVRIQAQDGTIRTQERALSVAVRHITELEALLRAAGIPVPAIPSVLAPYLSGVP